MGRKKVPINEKVIYQRVGIRYETYIRLKKNVEKEQSTRPKYTISDCIEELLDLDEKPSDE